MAKYFKKWKRDSKFRRNVIIGLILLYIFGGNFGDTLFSVTPEECESYNNAEWLGLYTKEAYSTCIAQGCTAEFKNNPEGPIPGFSDVIDTVGDWIVGIFGVSGETGAVCKAKADIGKYILADSVSEAKNKCSSYNVILVTNNWFSNNIYKCIQGDGDECKSWQEPFDGILDAVWKDNELDCSASAYLVIGFAVFGLLAVI